MKKSVSMACITTLLLGGTMNAFASGAGNNYVLNLIGNGPMYEDYVPDIDGDGVDDPAICFDTDLVDMQKGQTVGTATDCLSDVTPTGTGVALVGTTYFNFPQGELLVRGKTSVQPVLQPTESVSGQVMTHITGAASPDNALIAGARQFAGAEGTVRLSGMVDMSAFEGNVGDPISFDYIFYVDLRD